MKSQYAVCLPEVERARLRTLIGSGTAPARQLAHARLLLKADQGEGGPGWNDWAIAGALEVCTRTVARVRQQYVTAGLDAALNRRWPEGRQRWSLRLLVTELVQLDVVPAVSHETVRRTLKETT